jgi:hypothetical protein
MTDKVKVYKMRVIWRNGKAETLEFPSRKERDKEHERIWKMKLASFIKDL